MLRRCSIDSISHWAELILRLMYSRVFSSVLGRRQQLAIVGADEQIRRAAVFQPDFVLAPFAFLDEHVGRDVRHERLAEIRPRLGIQLAQLDQRLLDQLDRIAGAAFDLRQPIVLDVFQMIA